MNIDVPELCSMECPYMFPDEDTEKNDCIPKIDSKGYIYLCQLAAGENKTDGECEFRKENFANALFVKEINKDD